MRPVDLSDNLLYWISQRGSLAMGAFKAAAERLLAESMDDIDDRKQRVRLLWRSLQALGHVEIAKQRLHVVRPGLVYRVEAGGIVAFLFGGRSPWWSIELAESSEINFREIEQPNAIGPSCWQIEASQFETLARYAESFAWEVYQARPLDTLRALPTFKDAIKAVKTTKELRRGTEYFSTVGLRARWKIGEQRVGLFRDAKRPFANWHWIDEDSAAIIPPGSELRYVSKWLAITSQTKLVLGYDRPARRLAIPAVGASLPTILRRALVMRSGVLPTYERGNWVYSGVSHACAHEISRIMQCKIEEWQSERAD